MCGIVGVASIETQKSRNWLEEGRDSMQHRGPDDKGIWWSDNYKIGFAHRRLSILDLSHAGHQPMILPDDSVAITYNGEIYNYKEIRDLLSLDGYKFETGSDTEVILKSWDRWGADCVNYFVGMFAFAIYDKKNNKVFLARDRAGEKPLFYKYANKKIQFSSELKALLFDKNIQRKLNLNALDCYLAIGYVPQNLCIIEGIRKLEAGNTLLFDCSSGDITIKKYWDLPQLKQVNISTVDNVHQEQLSDELQTLLKDSIKDQMCADVPVGILLSGGVDSSLITGLACEVSNDVKTFNISFPNNKEFDESEHAKMIAAHFNTEHKTLSLDSMDPKILFDLAKQFDEPISDNSILPTFLVSKLVSGHCKVALGGDGGDEIFGGYHNYQRTLWLHSISKYIPIFLRKKISFLSELFLPVGFKGKYWLMALGTDFTKEIPIFGSLFSKSERKKLIKKSNLENFAEEFMSKNMPKDGDLPERLSKMDFKNYMVDNILVKVDRASMLNSLEIRAPFLDHRVIDFSFSKIGSSYKVTKKRKKILLKNLAKRILPKNFDFNRKKGFSIPISEWLKSGEWRELMENILYDEDCLFQKDYVEKIIKGLDKGRPNGERLLSLIIIEIWRKEYNISI